MTVIADGGGRKHGAMTQGMKSQVIKNTLLDPWLGDNTAAADPQKRRGEQIADITFIGAGGVLAGGSGIRLHQLHHVGGSGLYKAAVAAAGLAGIAWASAGVKNLLLSQPESPVIPLPPGKFPPKPPVEPKPPNPPGEQPKPPAEPKPPAKPKPPVEPKPPAKPKPKPKPPVQTPPAGPGKAKTHRVRPGEYVSYIAKCYNLTWQQVYWHNRKIIGPDPDVLRVGQQLRIPPRDLKVPAFGYKPSHTPGVAGHPPNCPPESPKANCPVK